MSPNENDPGPAQSPGFDLGGLCEARRGETMSLLREHVNPRFANVLKTIGFDRNYVRGKGAYLWDAGGRKYLDLLAGYGMFNLGRHHPVLQDAVRQFLELDEPTKPQMGAVLLSGLLAERLKGLAPWSDKVFFTNSGTESIEAALKFARASTKRHRVIYGERAFHGLTYGSLSINGCDSFRDGFMSLLPGMVSVPFGDLDALERELATEKTAAFVVEPVQGKGVHVAQDEFLLGAQELCRRHGTKLVVDEVQTGLGRTGKMLAIDHVPGLAPDILTLSKALSGGYVPVGAVLMRQDVYDGVFTSMNRSVVHSSTFAQMGLAMTCGLATLHVLENEDLPANAAARGAELIAGLRALQERHEVIAEVRGRGLMIGLELTRPENWARKLEWDLVHAADKSLMPQALVMPLLDDHGILTQVAGHHVDIVKMLPPLVLTSEDVETVLAAFADTLGKIDQFAGSALLIAKKLARFSLTAAR